MTTDNDTNETDDHPDKTATDARQGEVVFDSREKTKRYALIVGLALVILLAVFIF